MILVAGNDTDLWPELPLVQADTKGPWTFFSGSSRDTFLCHLQVLELVDPFIFRTSTMPPLCAFVL